VLECKQHPLILRLLAGQHRGVLPGADRDIAGRVGGAGEREQGGEPHPAPVIPEPAPAVSAVKVRDQLGIHQRAQLGRPEAGGPLDLATNRNRDAVGHRQLDSTAGASTSRAIDLPTGMSAVAVCSAK